MNEAKFWSIIAKARAESKKSTDPDEDFLDNVTEQLNALPPKEIAAFHQIVLNKNREAYSYGISGAMFVMTEGKADDVDFEGFRGWLISQGEEVFTKAIANADSLADEDVVPHDSYLPDMLTIAADLYTEVTAKEVPADSNKKPLELSGKEIEVKDLKKKLPRLCDEFIFDPEDHI